MSSVSARQQVFRQPGSHIVARHLGTTRIPRDMPREEITGKKRDRHGNYRGRTEAA